VQEIFTAKNKTFCILIDGSWDLKLCLLREAKQKNIELADHYYQYYDLKEEFTKMYRLRGVKTPSIKVMLRYLNIEMEGRPHCGIDDCVNICNIVIELLKQKRSHDDTFFDSPIVIDKKEYQPLKEMENAIDFNRSSTNSLFKPLSARKRKHESDDNNNEEIEEIEENEEKEESSKEETEEAKNIEEKEIEEKESVEDNVVDVNDEENALIDINDEENALIDISDESNDKERKESNEEVEEQEEEEEKDEEGEMDNDVKTNVVVLRGLPWTASEVEIKEFFKGDEKLNDKIKRDGIHILLDLNGRTSGIAYVEFDGYDDANKALMFHKKYMGNRYIEVYLADPDSVNIWNAQKNVVTQK